MIAFAEDYDACIKALQRFCDYVDISNGKKKDIEEIINTYCHQINTLLFNEEGFWTSFEMICHISQKRHINIDYYNKKSQTIKGDKSNLDISLINVILYKFSYFGQVVKMFTIMHKHHIRIHSDVICIAFEKALTIEDLTYLLETYSPLNIDSKIIVSHIRHFSSDMAELIYQYLVDISHPFNIYIYNTLLKICDIKFSIKLLDIMKESCISPDIQSIQPLICRCNDKYQFIRIISIASSLNIQPDTIMYRRVIKTIKDNIEFAHLINDIKTDDIQHHHISTLWMDLLVTSQKYG